MSDETAPGASNTAAPAETAQNKPVPPVPHLTRLQELEAAGRVLLADVKLGIIHTETGLSKELEAAELRFQQFVHNLTLHLEKVK